MATRRGTSTTILIEIPLRNGVFMATVSDGHSGGSTRYDCLEPAGPREGLVASGRTSLATDLLHRHAHATGTAEFPLPVASLLASFEYRGLERLSRFLVAARQAKDGGQIFAGALLRSDPSR
jgi:hypothetical protein